jgi:hypothetical protein
MPLAAPPCYGQCIPQMADDQNRRSLADAFRFLSTGYSGERLEDRAERPPEQCPGGDVWRAGRSRQAYPGGDGIESQRTEQACEQELVVHIDTTFMRTGMSRPAALQ